MTGKEKLIKYCQEHDGEEIYNFLDCLRNESMNYTDSRRFIIEWLDGNVQNAWLEQAARRGDDE